MKCSLGISNFLEEISSLSHAVVSLYFFALIAEEGFLISSCYFLELCIQMLISFLFSFAFFFFSNKNLFNLILFFNFTILYWFCLISTWIHHSYMCSTSWTLLPPRTFPLGHSSATAPSIHYRASNLDWWLVSYMILYMFQCRSPKSSHPLPLGAICKASSDKNFIFLHFFSMGMVLIPVSYTTSRTSVHRSSGTLSIRSRPLNLFLTSTV